MYDISNYWFDRQGSQYKWQTLYHNGVLFPPEYVKHNIPVTYANQQIVLDTEAEEFATLYSKYTDTEYINSKVFRKNFWHDWKKLLGKDHPIKSLEECDFKAIYNHLLEKKQLPKENKDELKKAEEVFTYATVDGKQQKVSNYHIEPPGIFLGRGCNPKLGKIKHRLYPENVILNLSKDAPIPKPMQIKDGTIVEMKNHKWKSILHDRSVEWLASFKDNINNKTKYVWLGAQSELKAQSDIHKFDLARKLKKKIKTIRNDNITNLTNPDLYTRQIATALYFIDKLALRVGNEKGEDETDTVGVTSLRIEHIALLDDNKLKLDFHGKDYVRYTNTFEVIPEVYNNIKEFITNKQPTDQLFDQINAQDINLYLQTFMKGLTAKVFRTYNASNLFQKELLKINKKYDDKSVTDADNKENKVNKLLDEFNLANAKVAILCNHQKNISKSFADQLEKLNANIKKTRASIANAKSKEKKDKLKHKLDMLKTKKSLKIQMKSISLGTSKINYIDPRISIAFLKKHNIPIDSIFSKTLQEKFTWALESTDTDFVF